MPPHIRPVRFVISLYLLGVLFVTAIEGWNYVAVLHPYSVGDWLINYQGGFVRRGLIGEISLFFQREFGLPQLTFTYALQMLFYAAFLYFSYRLILIQDSLWPFYLLIFAPFTLDFEIFGTGLRKDLFYLASVAAMLYVAKVKNEGTFLSIYYGLLLAYPLVILSHEAMFAFLPYLIAALFIRIETPAAHHWKYTAVLASLSLIAFLFAAFTRADWETVRQICHSLGSIAPSDCATLDHTGAITWLVLDTSTAMQSVLSRIKWDGYLSVYSLSLMMVMIAFAPAYRHLILLLRHRVVVLLVAGSLAMTVGLAAVMLDWGRLIHIQAMSLFLLCLAVGDRVAAEADGIGIVGERLSGGSFLLERRALQGAFVLLLLAYATTWNISLCCSDKMGLGVLSLVQGVVVSWLKHGAVLPL